MFLMYKYDDKTTKISYGFLYFLLINNDVKYTKFSLIIYFRWCKYDDIKIKISHNIIY